MAGSAYQSYANANDFNGLLAYFFRAGDSISGSGYSDILRGFAGNDSIASGRGHDKVRGDSGNDRLTGGLGKDSLTGGTGYDIFDFNALAESGITSTTRDIITDFVRGQDKMDLSTIDANTATSGNAAFTKFIASTAAFTAAGQLKFSGGVLYGNTDADSTAEFSIQLTGVSALSTADFVV